MVIGLVASASISGCGSLSKQDVQATSAAVAHVTEVAQAKAQATGTSVALAQATETAAPRLTATARAQANARQTAAPKQTATARRIAAAKAKAKATQSAQAAAQAAQLAASPHLFSPPSALENNWSHDYSVFANWPGKYCARGVGHPKPKNDVCLYSANGIHVSVIYSEGVAWAMDLPVYDPADGVGNRDPSSDTYWTFLQSLVPPGARQYACRTVKNSSSGGPARVCLYHYHFIGGILGGGNTVIVAQFLSPSEGNDNATIEPDDSHMGFGAVQGG